MEKIGFWGDERRNICNLLLSSTHSRSLPKGLQLHAHIIKSGLQTIPLISHHLINFYSKTQLPLFSRQIFLEAPHKSATTWSSVISSLAQNELPSLAIQFFQFEDFESKQIIAEPENQTISLHLWAVKQKLFTWSSVTVTK
ncbi:putative pentatricopeptide repeat-containing protein [Corchorus capsularis]|uniref:Putative pentatricopeptide repeat-containing protein n=1 Tax=Corchorus capsularis TaxID=210143 RepID=A0A1R3J442_COCAP|nr:putative pentatricopeptide repeat-containing protein [Corchorus capsularis]